MISALALTRFRYFTRREDYLQWLSSPEGQPRRRLDEAAIIEAARLGSVTLHCHAHGGMGQLTVPTPQDGFYNWRESGTCTVCDNISRVRLAAEWIHRAAENYSEPRIYITEQLTPLYKALRSVFQNLAGSEYVPDTLARIKSSATLAMYTADVSARIRHEDVCQLTFADASLDLIGSFDVLEHVPNYTQAIAEFFRVLNVGGQLLLTVPFLAGSATTLVRARMMGDTLEHLETPEYHGNPTKPRDGLLCYYHFGWDLLGDLRKAGFRSIAFLDAWGFETAIFGNQNGIVATK